MKTQRDKVSRENISINTSPQTLHRGTLHGHSTDPSHHHYHKNKPRTIETERQRERDCSSTSSATLYRVRC